MARYDTGSTQTARWGWSVLGFQSVHAFPMRVRSQILGADRARFHADDVRVVQALADVATAAIVDDLDTSKS